MKKTTLGMLFLTVAVLLTSCTKEITKVDLQEANAGSIIWNWALDSLTVETNHTTFRAKDVPALQDDGIVFFADRTGIRFQGENHFSEAPQVDSLRFQWGQNFDQTNEFYLQAIGAGPNDPKNVIMTSTNLTNQFLKLAVIGNKSYYTYYYHQVSH